MFHHYSTPSQVSAPVRAVVEEGGSASIQYLVEMVLVETKNLPYMLLGACSVAVV